MAGRLFNVSQPSVDLHLHTAIAERAPGLSQGQRNLRDTVPKTLKPEGGQNYLYRTHLDVYKLIQTCWHLMLYVVLSYNQISCICV